MSTPQTTNERLAHLIGFALVVGCTLAGLGILVRGIVDLVRWFA